MQYLLRLLKLASDETVVPVESAAARRDLAIASLNFLSSLFAHPMHTRIEQHVVVVGITVAYYCVSFLMLACTLMPSGLQYMGALLPQLELVNDPSSVCDLVLLALTLRCLVHLTTCLGNMAKGKINTGLTTTLKIRRPSGQTASVCQVGLRLTIFSLETDW